LPRLDFALSDQQSAATSLKSERICVTLSIHPVILCGGSGTRLWPRSRATKPKPFLPLVGDSTLFEATVGRGAPQHGFAPPLVVTGAKHIEHVSAQLGGIADATIIVEPSAQNTAAAIALAAVRLDPDAIMLVCPSDHHIADGDAFRAAAKSAAALASAGYLVSFGIEAKSPETGFGYLERGEPIEHGGYRVARFVEKPQRDVAEQFVAAGTHAWNGGIFAFRVGTFLDELGQHAPDILAAVTAADAAGHAEGQRFYPDASAFGGFNPLSVDYAVMENTGNAAMVPVDMGWSDIGSWDALHAALECDETGNCSQGDAELVDCRNVLVTTDGPRVSVIGLEDVIVVVDGNDVMVTTRAGAQKVGKLMGAVNQ
jgi:mannose-1-phosphate guanylyltransferase/mannose-1-phosphate guanylyltransferase/mannose-6-phosphate isomerase